MLPKKKIEGLVEYWIENSKRKFKSMEQLYEGKSYPDALYYGHMILEMALKACVVMKTGEQAPYKHNLKYLAQLADLNFDEKDMEFLGEVNDFNMEARYPEEKMDFFKKCTKTYTDRFYKPIISLHEKLCQKATLRK